MINILIGDLYWAELEDRFLNIIGTHTKFHVKRGPFSYLENQNKVGAFVRRFLEAKNKNDFWDQQYKIPETTVEFSIEFKEIKTELLSIDLKEIKRMMLATGWGFNLVNGKIELAGHKSNISKQKIKNLCNYLIHETNLELIYQLMRKEIEKRGDSYVSFE